MLSGLKLLRAPGLRAWSNATFLACQRVGQRQLYLQKRSITIRGESLPISPRNVDQNPEILGSDEKEEDLGLLERVDQKPTPSPGFGKHLKTFSTTEFQPLDGEFDWKSNATYVSSFSADLDKKTIYVPGSPPKWNANDPPFRYGEIQHADSLELREIRLASYFAALRHLCPTYDYSRVHIDCDWEVLASLYSIFPLASKNQYDDRRHAHGKIPATFTLSTVSNTLFIRRRPAPEVDHEQSAKASLREFMPTAVTSDPNLPASARSVYSVEYELGPFKCVVHFSPDAWSNHDPVPRDIQLAPNLHGKPATPEESNSDSPFRVHQVGEPISLSDLLLVQSVKDAKGLEHYKHLPLKRAESLRNKIVQQKHRIAGHRLWSKIFFSRIPTTYRVTLEEGTKLCLKVTSHKNELILSEADIDHLRRMFSLLVALREATKSSKNEVCVLQLSNGPRIGKQEETKIDLWEPEFEDAASRAHDLPEHLRVPRQIVSDEDYGQFWLANGKEPHENLSERS